MTSVSGHPELPRDAAALKAAIPDILTKVGAVCAAFRAVTGDLCFHASGVELEEIGQIQVLHSVVVGRDVIPSTPLVRRTRYEMDPKRHPFHTVLEIRVQGAEGGNNPSMRASAIV